MQSKLLNRLIVRLVRFTLFVCGGAFLLQPLDERFTWFFWLSLAWLFWLGLGWLMTALEIVLYGDEL